MRRILALWMAVVMAVATPVSVLANVTDESGDDSASEVVFLSTVASGTCGDNLTWVLDNEGTLTISGTGEMYDWTYIPSERAPWNNLAYNIFTVIIEDGVESIGKYAFYRDDIEKVEIPDSVTKISSNAFWYCTSLTTITIPDSVKEMGSSVFYRCESLTSIKIPDGVTSIGETTFLGCTSLATVTIPDSVTSIGLLAFRDCESLTNIVIPEGVTIIKNQTFYGCSSLINITIPKSVTEIESLAFYGCSSLTDVYYGGTKSEWKMIVIGSSNASLNNATIHCTNGILTKTLYDCIITLSPSSYTYDGSPKYPAIIVEDGNTTLTDGTDYSVSYSNNTNAGTASAVVAGIGEYTGSIAIPFTINKANQTVTAWSSASSIDVGETATIFARGKGTITYSSSDTSVATVSSKGVVTGKAEGTAKITVNAAGDSNYNAASTTVSIKVSLKQGSTYTSGSFKYMITSLPSSGTGKVTVTAPAKSTITKATIPATVKIGGRSFKVTQIATGAFKNCKKLKSATVGKNVTTIGNGAFYNCTALTKVTGCTAVTSIGSRAFYKCTKLTRVGSKASTVTLAKVKTIGSRAFYGCKAIKKVNLTSTALTTISTSAFQGCTAMTNFTAKSTKLKSIGKKAFYGDKKLATVTLKTSKLTKSNVKTNAFKGIKSTCTFKVPSKKVSSYKKIFKAAGAGSKITVKKG